MSEIYKKEIPVNAPEYQVQNASDVARVPKVGATVKEVAVATYDVSGGDSGAVGAHGLGVYIPDNAVITKVWYDVVTTFTDGASDTATLALTIQSAGDAVAAIAISAATNVWDAGVHGSVIGFPAIAGSTATDTAIEVAALFAASYVKTTAIREITVTVATAALTAGKMRVFVEYFISD